MQFPRAAGLLLPIASLPGRYSIGDLGPEAYRFVDFLEQSGQSVWQVLPLGPTSTGNSPYSCYSAFAGNPLLISPEQLVEDGWLETSDLDASTIPAKNESQIDYELAAQVKRPLLQRAYENARESLNDNQELAAFCLRQKDWLVDFARFEALQEHFKTSDWTTWPAELIERTNASLNEWDSKLADAILFSKFCQFLFDQQWRRLKQYANQRSVQLFGDMPIFVARDSSDVWANQSIFYLDEHGNTTSVAGVPPDYFSEDGQRWGNPLYRWDVLEERQFDWWTHRFRAAFEQYDWLRVDHFRGFESYWEIPAECETARDGKWQPGPGVKPFHAAAAELGELAIVAEDLGMITEQVHQLRDALGFPAMRVMQFGFDDEDDLFHHPEHFPEHSFAYTGTHDNDTVMGWYNQRMENPPPNDLLERILHADEPIHLQLIASVFRSRSCVAIVPMQDCLGLDSESRMNTPGQADGNWGWRLQRERLQSKLAKRLKELSVATGRSV